MAIALGQNQYGKAETRVLRVYRDSDRHEIRDLAVSTSLRGDFADAHTRGDQAHVLPTDSQKNTCFAYAKEKGVGEIEDYAMELARHFTADVPYVSGARVEVDEYRWDRVAVAAARHPAGQPPDGRPGHGHTFVRAGPDVRTTAVTVEGRGSRQRAPPDPPRTLRDHPQPGAAADPVGDGLSRAAGTNRRGGDPPVRAEQAPLPRRPGAFRAGQRR